MALALHFSESSEGDLYAYFFGSERGGEREFPGPFELRRFIFPKSGG
jgi:hypothetical protein